MKLILKSIDFGDVGFPKLKDMIKDIDIDKKKMVLEYLKAPRFYRASAPARIKDILGNGYIPNSTNAYSDGEFDWTSDEVYYFEKYNVAISEELINKIIA